MGSTHSQVEESGEGPIVTFKHAINIHQSIEETYCLDVIK